MLFTKAQADQFFKALRACSVEIMKYFGLPWDPGFKTRPWAHGKPVGVTEHFTAGVVWKGSISWLNGQGNKAASCHALILDRMIAEVEAIKSKYPELDILPVLVILMGELSYGMWHGGWVNSLNFGIENRNAGPLRGEQGDWRWWAKKWTAKFPHEKLGKVPQNFDGKWWEPYTYGQIVANIILCQMLYCLYEGDLDKRWFLPHSATTGTKFDTGRAFPLDNVRTAVFEQQPHVDLAWLQDFKADPMYMDDYDEEEDLEFLQEMALRQAERSGDDVDFEEDLVVVEEPPGADLQMLVEDGKWREELGAVRRGLARLQYVVPATSSEVLDNDTALASYQFQRSMGLKADKIPGGKTQAAIMTRLKHFRLHT
jgi:hypothetical protein